MDDRFRRTNHRFMQPATQANSASYPGVMGSEYWPKYGDALRVSSKGRMAHFMWINVWMVGKTV